MTLTEDVRHYARMRDFQTREELTACGLEIERDTLSTPTGHEVTCAACTKHQNLAALRSGLRQDVEKTQTNAVGMAVMDLCVWEGRGDWSRLTQQSRDEAGQSAVAHLDLAIARLQAERTQLLAILKMENNLPTERTDA